MLLLGFASKAAELADTAGQHTPLPEERVKALRTKRADAQHWGFFLKNLGSLAAPHNSLN